MGPIIVVLPSFVPPRKADYSRPAERNKISQRFVRPGGLIDMLMTCGDPEL
jgi:hypothetical protein